MTKEREQIDDLQLVEFVKQGDRSAFSALMLRHQRAVLRMAIRFVRDPDLAEDVVQDAFIKAYEKIHLFEARASFKSWLFQIAANTARNKIRERREGHVDVENTPLAVSATAETVLVQGSVAELIGDLVQKLPERQRMALTLRIYEDLSFQEIAQIMGCPYDTAKANYRHGLLRIQKDVKKLTDLADWERLSEVFEVPQLTAEVER